MRSHLKTRMSTHTERMARLEEEAGCFVLLPTGPTAGDMAPRARDLLTGDTDQQGTVQNSGLLTAPGIVKSLFLHKPERIEALGRIFWLALRRWRVMARTMRRPVDTTRTPLPGWDTHVTERPTSCMMVTQCAGVIVVQRGSHRQLTRPRAGVHHQYLTARDVPATCGTLPTGAQRIVMAAQRRSRRHTHLLPWLAADHQRPRGRITRSHQGPGQTGVHSAYIGDAVCRCECGHSS